jgi:hypothetical protein
MILQDSELENVMLILAYRDEESVHVLEMGLLVDVREVPDIQLAVQSRR